MTTGKQIVGWVIRIVAILVCVGAVGLCVVSAILSIMKLIKTYNTPASSYVQKTLTGFHTVPGIVFAGVDLSLHRCETFNFTSLDIEALNKRSKCDPMTFTIYSSTPPDNAAMMNSMPVMLKELQGEMSFMLLEGPKDWSNKETTSFHLSIPNELSGVWAIVHPDYEAVRDLFAVVSNSASSLEQRWDVARDLLIGYSANFVTPNYQAFYLMSKRIFKSFGEVDAIRIDMEIAILEQNETDLDLNLPRERSPSGYEHLELYYQWKDGNYMEGDK
ncbi:uncharacterized protein LOC142336999 [Convolutriloba macropyga]|uniref:uncharacterized protein LOC142336999 n=1 Tax=Convolutriloba macropyga TaxID=536237 RepID=UPI003F5266D4